MFYGLQQKFTREGPSIVKDVLYMKPTTQRSVDRAGQPKEVALTMHQPKPITFTNDGLVASDNDSTIGEGAPEYPAGIYHIETTEVNLPESRLSVPAKNCIADLKPSAIPKNTSQLSPNGADGEGSLAASSSGSSSKYDTYPQSVPTGSSNASCEMTSTEEDLLSKKRKMNIIYSRRKREKKKSQVAALCSRSAELRRENAELREATSRLENLVEDAVFMVAQLERAAALHSLPDLALSPVMLSASCNSVCQRRTVDRQSFAFAAERYFPRSSMPADLALTLQPGVVPFAPNEPQRIFPTLIDSPTTAVGFSSTSQLLGQLMAQQRHQQLLERERGQAVLEQSLQLRLALQRQREAHLCQDIMRSTNAHGLAFAAASGGSRQEIAAPSVQDLILSSLLAGHDPSLRSNPTSRVRESGVDQAHLRRK